ncbi:hypothetical protein KD33_07835 [Clostridium sp. NCR]|nr:hypothetical protein KD33_07835 [Clostridium sp. NCR]
MYITIGEEIISLDNIYSVKIMWDNVKGDYIKIRYNDERFKNIKAVSKEDATFIFNKIQHKLGCA